ncbi:MAG: glycosyltransferase family 2 protein [Gammaproteobacteria bacterium]
MATITVGMPVYNGEQYLESAISAVLEQTFDDFELLIADNASSDQSGDICRDLAAGDSRIRYLRNQKNIGAAANYNLLYDQARTPYFRWSNADDLLDPTLHQKCYDALVAHPEAALAAGTTILIDGDGNETGAYDDNLHIVDPRPSRRLCSFLRRVGMTNVIYGLMRTDALKHTDLMGNGTVPAADTIFMGQLVLQGAFIKLDEPLFYRRMHELSSSADRADTSKQQSFWSAGEKKFKRAGWKSLAAYRRAIARTPLDAGESLALYQLLLQEMWANKRQLSAELIHS